MGELMIASTVALFVGSFMLIITTTGLSVPVMIGLVGLQLSFATALEIDLDEREPVVIEADSLGVEVEATDNRTGNEG